MCTPTSCIRCSISSLNLGGDVLAFLAFSNPVACTLAACTSWTTHRRWRSRTAWGARSSSVGLATSRAHGRIMSLSAEHSCPAANAPWSPHQLISGKYPGIQSYSTALPVLCFNHSRSWSGNKRSQDAGCDAGPVDGPAIFNNCSGGQVAVACQQFQAKNCSDVEFGAHVAQQSRALTQPYSQIQP